MARPGSAEFDSYSQKVKISDLDKRVGERLNNRYARLLFSVQNAGDKILEGLELRGAVSGDGGDVLYRKTVSPIPGQAIELGPNGSINVELYIEPIPDTSEIKDFRVEVTGLDVDD
jgi:hypothetical protein